MDPTPTDPLALADLITPPLAELISLSIHDTIHRHDGLDAGPDLLPTIFAGVAIDCVLALHVHYPDWHTRLAHHRLRSAGYAIADPAALGRIALGTPLPSVSGDSTRSPSSGLTPPMVPPALENSDLD